MNEDGKKTQHVLVAFLRGLIAIHSRLAALHFDYFNFGYRIYGHPIFSF